LGAEPLACRLRSWLALALLIVGDAVIRSRWTLTRDLLAGVAIVLVVGSILGRIVGEDWFRAELHVFSHWGFPELRLACAVAIFAVAGPELVRPARRASAWLVAAAGLGAVVLGTGLPSEVLGAIALGLGSGALVRLALGSAAGVPSTGHVREALASLGVDVDNLRLATQQRIGRAEYYGETMDKRPIKVRVLGRDAQDTQRLAPPLAAARLSGSAAKCTGRSTRAGRARGSRDADGSTGRRARA
jgi:hypothetical protein